MIKTDLKFFGGRGARGNFKTSTGGGMKMPDLTGTQKQIDWANDIRKQTLTAAHEVYDRDPFYKTDGLTFEESNVGHIATFAAQNVTDARFWIDEIGNGIQDYENWSEAAKTNNALKGIITSITPGFTAIGLYDKYESEEKQLDVIRKDKRDKAREERRKAREARNT